jgi:hypothetical protein
MLTLRLLLARRLLGLLLRSLGSKGLFIAKTLDLDELRPLPLSMLCLELPHDDGTNNSGTTNDPHPLRTCDSDHHDHLRFTCFVVTALPRLMACAFELRDDSGSGRG